ncbi:hypothetical protein [Winogradskyella sp.]|uniref:hypothetical protein n=1 Tax=Winogradskyella sp. TaxID=1883156 RepID=UPI0026062F96|nr:hypothetical protein [Winogradskyella sp.]
MEEKIKFSKVETYFLQLLAHNCDFNTISDFLEMDKSNLRLLYDVITVKTSKKNTYDLMKLAFKNQVLKKYDYLDSIIKKEASTVAALILSHIKTNVYDSGYLKKMISSFIVNSESKMLQKHSQFLNRNRITDGDIKLVNEKYKRFNNRKIVDEDLAMFKSSLNLIRPEGIVLRKLKANCWYNALRKVFQMKMLNTNDFDSIDLQIEVEKIANNINNRVHQKLYRKKEKVFYIYIELLNLYMDIEYKMLFEKKVYS